MGKQSSLGLRLSCCGFCFVRFSLRIPKPCGSRGSKLCAIGTVVRREMEKIAHRFYGKTVIHFILFYFFGWTFYSVVFFRSNRTPSFSSCFFFFPPPNLQFLTLFERKSMWCLDQYIIHGRMGTYTFNREVSWCAAFWCILRVFSPRGAVLT